MKNINQITDCINEITTTLLDRIIEKGNRPLPHGEYLRTFKPSIKHIEKNYPDDTLEVIADTYYSCTSDTYKRKNYGEIHIYFVALFDLYKSQNQIYSKITIPKAVDYLMEVMTPILYKHGIKSISIGSNELRILNTITKRYDISSIKVC